VDKATFDRLEQKVEQKYSGARNAGRSIIAAGGLKFTPNVMTPQELNYVQGRKLIREEIAAAFGVPISCLVATDVNRANAEVADYRHAKNAILPRLRRIEQKLNEKMLPLFDDKLFVAFDNPVADDKEYGFKKTAEFLARGVYTINDVRGDEGMDDAEWGDMPWLPSTLTQVGQEPPTPAIPTIVVNPEGSEQDAEAVPASDSGAQPVEEMADMVLEKVRERLGA
jgi:HK97 family phage portal protein